MNPAVRRLALRLGLALTLMGLGLLGTELLLRALGVGAPMHASPLRVAPGVVQAPLTVYDPYLMYRAAPGVEFLDYYRTNRFGWRGPPPAEVRAPDSLRIACLGDSSTMGLGVREESAWPFRLRAMLARALPDTEVEVINLGTTGYSSWQNRVQLERQVPSLDVDAVVILPTGVNDAAHTEGPPDGVLLAGAVGWLARLQRTHLARALGLSRNEQILSARRVGGSRDRVSEAEFVANVRSMVATCAERDVPLVLVAGPTSAEGRGREPRYERAVRAVARVSRQTDTPLADARDEFLAAEPSRLFVDPVHPDEVGHGILARRVLAQLAQHPRVLADGAERAFLREAFAVRAAGERGWLHDAALELASPPAVFTQALERARVGDDLPDMTSEGGCHLRARSATSADAVEAWRRRADTLADQVVPRDPLAIYLAALRRDPAGAERAVALAAWERWLCGETVSRDRRVALARRLHEDGYPAQAMALLEDVLRLRPGSAEALTAMVQIAEGLGWRSVADLLVTRFDHGVRSAAGLSALGLRWFREGCLNEAEEVLRRSLELQPLLLRSRYLLGCVLLRARKDYDEAEFHLATTRAVSARAYPDIPELLEKVQRARRHDRRRQDLTDGVVEP